MRCTGRGRPGAWTLLRVTKNLRLVLGLTVTAATFTAFSAGTARGEIYLAGQCTDSEVQPPTIILACADAALRLDNLTWQDWGTPTATGQGQLVQPDCPPDVPLAGCETRRSDAATVTAYGARLCPQDRKTHYTQIHVIAPTAKESFDQDFVQTRSCQLYPDRFLPLGGAKAKSWVRITMSNQPRLAWDAAATGHRLSCGKRLALRVRSCRVGWAVGDAAFVGRVVIHKLTAYSWKASWRLRLINEYCLLVAHGKHCVKHITGRDKGFGRVLGLRFQ
jgi:hypothetical protein